MDKEELLRTIQRAADEGWTELDLSDKDLTEIPPEIGQLTELKALKLSENRLRDLPPEIGRLTNIETLIIIRNELNSLPPEVGQLTELTELTLYLNNLAELPPEIGQLTKLETLHIAHNKLNSLPSEIGQLTKLTGLYLGKNKLTVLPPEIGQLANLTILHLDGNQLTSLPPEIGDLVNLKSLGLAGNPLIAPPPEIVDQGTKAVLAYLQEQREGARTQWVSKLLVVGQGGVGKTALLRSLRGKGFVQDLSTTHGIAVEPLGIEHPIDQDVTMQLNTWDFGGQEIYHATHQFFLTNRSLFVLVWNARHGYEQGKLYYWLDAIQARAPESSILLVATHIDERDADIPLAELRAKYPQIVGQCEISNKDGMGIEELRNALAGAAASLPLMGENWPTGWLNAAEDVRAREEKHITPRQLWTIMADHGVTDVNASILTQWMHELGDILFYRDDKELNDLVILKPQWVTEYISKVLESEDVIGLDGIFTREHMELLWGDLSMDLRDHFLRLMEQFDLSYRTLENREISLVVERLPLDPPDFATEWDAIKQRKPCREISMKFELNTVPAGIPTWFIARSHRFTTHTHWRTGALFTDSADRKHLALVRAFLHERQIQLTVRGPNPHNFFSLLKDGLELTLRRFPGLTIYRMIPCPGHSDAPCEHQFNYANLVKAIERDPPMEQIQCPVSFEITSVPELLFGLHWRTQDDVLERIEDLEARTDAGDEEALADLVALRELSQREFLNIYRREQSRIESHCPNVFVLRPRNGPIRKKLLDGQKLDLQLYCQAPGEWHPTEKGGLYEIDDPPGWAISTAPYIGKLVRFLRHATPVVGAGVTVIWPEFHELIKNDIKLMTEFIRLMPNQVEDRNVRLDHPTGESHRPERSGSTELQAIRQLLDEKDPDHVWGGLTKILTPEGHYLWLCDHHAREYA